MNNYLSVKECAEALNISLRQIRYLCAGRVINRNNKVITYPAKFTDVKTSVSVKNKMKYLINETELKKFKGNKNVQNN